MSQPKYHPQQDVFRIIDGKRENIAPYQFGQGEEKKPKGEGTRFEVRRK